MAKGRKLLQSWPGDALVPSARLRGGQREDDVQRIWKGGISVTDRWCGLIVCDCLDSLPESLVAWDTPYVGCQSVVRTLVMWWLSVQHSGHKRQDCWFESQSPLVCIA